MTQAGLKIGDKVADGSVFAGLTADGKQQIFAMPKDLTTKFLKIRLQVTFNDAVKAVKKLNDRNALGHSDWQIGSIDVTQVLKKNRHEGCLEGSFKSISLREDSFSSWYWSSTPDREFPWRMRVVGFSSDDEVSLDKNYDRLNCRPVRLVAVPGV